MWAASGPHLLGPSPNVHDAGPEPWPGGVQWRVEICPRLGRTLLILSVTCLSDATALLVRRLSIKSVGLNLDEDDLNAEFFEWRNG